MRLIPTGERSGLQTPTAITESVSLCVLTETLTALLELQAATHRQPGSSQSADRAGRPDAARAHHEQQNGARVL
jgi:hypothetical protein